MPAPLPDTVKTALSELTSAQQVILRGYIATLREQIKEFEEKALSSIDPDPHAHYHGTEKCTVDHGHDGGAHGHGHGHGETDDAHGHHDAQDDHNMEHATCSNNDHCGAERAHTQEHHHDHHHDHHHKEPTSGHDHGHQHHADCKHESHDHHEHKHEHTAESAHVHESGQKHHQEDEEHDEKMPAWKKKALAAGNHDPLAAPFGGDWKTESSVSASEEPMEE